MAKNKCFKLFQSAEEIAEPELGLINGSIPEWLNGTFLRTGAAKWDMDDGKFTCNHYFDGYAMLSKFHIDGTQQTVSFDKKFLKSDTYLRGMAAKRPVITEFGTPSYPDPKKSFLSKMLAACLPIELSDNNIGGFFELGQEVFVTSETCFFRGVDHSSLATGEKYDSNKLFGLNIDSSHPIMDESGTTWNMGSTFLTGLKYNFVKIPPPASNHSAKDLMKKSKIVASIPSSWTGLMSYNHQSFIVTKNYLIFIEQPFVMNIGKAAKSILKGSPTFSQYVEWRPDLKNRFFVIEKQTGKVLKNEIYGSSPFFFLHFINAYEENDQIIVDLISYEDASFIESMYLEKLRSGNVTGVSKGAAHRYVIPILSDPKTVTEGVNLVCVKSTARAVRSGSSIVLTPEVLTQPGFEYPIINKKRLGKKNSYFYASGSLGESAFENSITKFDVSKKVNTTWVGESTQYPGEPQLILNPNAKTEDDGVLISAVTDEKPDGNDFLLFLDAKTMEEVGRVLFQTHVPFSCHGHFIPKTKTLHRKSSNF